ncbi:alkyl sulfatase C-terminal domain-containing protein [Catellatospora sichuanensis]|uniref:alkyl sulfatase C-terminal domain-containing protein n=1 Tax=Catellatospora sichuanensis TaxID=1969805 RepID=UPI0011840C12|nr:alkyl sulfatase C-terminal domain-containing protein [Catellatospora sichuanensis]
MHGPAQRPDVTVTIDADAFLEIAEGRSTLAEAVDAGRATASGDTRVLRLLKKLFRRPSPQTRQPAR